MSRLDFQLGYTPFRQVTLIFDANNLLGEPFRNFATYSAGGGATSRNKAVGRFPRDVRFEETW